MSKSLRPKVFIMSGLFLIPVAICWGIAYGLVRGEEKEFSSAVEVPGVVAEVLEDRVRFNGRDSEDVTEVRVSFTPTDATAPIVASTTVWSARGLTAGGAVTVRYLPSNPQKFLLRAGFWNRSSGVVFLTIFGAFWLILDLGLTVLLLRLVRRPLPVG